MTIHLTTVVGQYFGILPFMLRHYQEHGITSILVNVHQSSTDDPALETVTKIASNAGLPIASATVGAWHLQVQEIYSRSRALHPNDWYVLADGDELHRYPDDLRDILAFCDRRGYDYLTGCFLDRLGPGGILPKLAMDRPLDQQFPIAGCLTHPLLGGDPRKVVAAKGHVWINRGQHLALNGIGCPASEFFVQVHHFKWVRDNLPFLEQRARRLQEVGERHWFQSHRVLEYFRTNGNRVNVNDPRLKLAPCVPEYPRWDEVRLELPEIHRKRRALDVRSYRQWRLGASARVAAQVG